MFATKLGKSRSDLSTTGPRANEHSRSGNEKESSVTQQKRYHFKVEYPFDSTVKRMSTVYVDRQHPDTHLALLKGAVERVLNCCTMYLASPTAGTDHVVPLTPEVKERMLVVMEHLADQGLRILALASRRLEEPVDVDCQRETIERNFTFIGFVGIYDPPRPESISAVRACKEASITVHM